MKERNNAADAGTIVATSNRRPHAIDWTRSHTICLIAIAGIAVASIGCVPRSASNAPSQPTEGHPDVTTGDSTATDSTPRPPQPTTISIAAASDLKFGLP